MRHSVRSRSSGPVSRVLSWALLSACVLFAPLCHTRLIDSVARSVIQAKHASVGPGDLYSPWFGARAALRGADPYAPAVTEQIESDVYGQPLTPQSHLDRMAFVYPAHLIFLMGPFTLLRWHTALFLFALLGEPLLAAASWAWMRLCLPDSTRTQMFVAVVFSISSWPAVCASWQPTVLILALAAISVLLFSRGFDVVPGVMLALSTVKPNLIALLIAWLLLSAFARRRFRFVIAFGSSLSLLLLGSLLLVPGWIPRWIRVVGVYSLSSGKHALPVDLFGPRIGFAVLTFLLGAILYRLIRIGMPAPRSPAFAQAIALLLAGTAWAIPSNPWMLYNNLLLVPAVLLLYPWRPARETTAFFRAVAAGALVVSLGLGPLCAVLTSVVGYTPFVALLPSVVNFILPLAIAPAILSCAGGADPSSASADGLRMDPDSCTHHECPEIVL